MDDFFETSSDEMPPLIDDSEDEVDMPPFPNLQNLQPLVVEEVPIEDLIPFEDLAPNQNQNPLGGPADLQIGMVQTHFASPDPMQHLKFNLNGSFNKLDQQQAFFPKSLFQQQMEKQAQELPHFDLSPVMQNQNGLNEMFQQSIGPSCQSPSFSCSPSPDAIRLWAKFFNNIDQSQPSVVVPMQWMNFFTLLLLK